MAYSYFNYFRFWQSTMEWGAMFNESGGFNIPSETIYKAEEDLTTMYSQTEATAGQKRPGEAEAFEGAKKKKQEEETPNWDQWGSTGDDFSQLNQITSWDQISAQNKATATHGNPAISQNSRKGGYSQFDKAESHGNYGDRGYGGSGRSRGSGGQDLWDRQSATGQGNYTDSGRAGYNRDSGRGGYNRDSGRGGYNRDSGRGGYNRDSGREGYNRDQGRRGGHGGGRGKGRDANRGIKQII